MFTGYLVPVLLISFQCVSAQLPVLDGLASTLSDAFVGDVPDLCELVNEIGYPCERHEVTTEDGYILSLSRIPGDPTKIVFLQHGFLDSAETWVLRGLDSPAIWLAKKFYDVWMGNTRGNELSRAHVYLNPDVPLGEFWNFSFHEMAIHDIPAMIDYILEKTGQSQLQVVAHSQGTTLFSVLGSLLPEYVAKIKVVLMLAPIAYLHHAQAPLFTLVSLAGGPPLSEIVGFLGRGEFLRNSSVLGTVFQLACTQGLISYPLCGLGIASVLFDPDPAQFEPEFADKAFERYPAGTSMKNAVHMLQILASRRFQLYDYGILGNLKRYKSVRPPLYDLSKVPFKLAFYVGTNDRLSAIEDVELLRAEVTTEVEYRVLELRNHVDFIWGKDMATYLFGHMLDTLEANY